MDFARLKRAVLIGLIAAAVIFVLGVAFVLLRPDPGPRRDVTVNLAVVTDTPKYYWAAVYVAEPLTPDEYKEIAKSIGDEHFRGRYGQVQVFDDEWARSTMLPENQGREFTDEEAARVFQHLKMTYTYDGQGHSFSR